jgi:pectate lyase
VYADIFAENDFGKATVNITQVGNFTRAPYKYKLTPLKDVTKIVKGGAGIGKI